MFSNRDISLGCVRAREKFLFHELTMSSVRRVWSVNNTHLFKVLTGGVFISTPGPTGEFGFVLAVLPDRQVPPSGEQARRFDFRYERFLNKSLKRAKKRMKGGDSHWKLIEKNKKTELLLPWLFRILQLQSDLCEEADQQLVDIVIDSHGRLDEFAIISRRHSFALWNGKHNWKLKIVRSEMKGKNVSVDIWSQLGNWDSCFSSEMNWCPMSLDSRHFEKAWKIEVEPIRWNIHRVYKLSLNCSKCVFCSANELRFHYRAMFSLLKWILTLTSHSSTSQSFV